MTLVRRAGELGKVFYQLPLISIALLQADLKMLAFSRHVPFSGHDDVAIFERRRQ